MGQNTNIEWTDATWNPVRGCSRVSPGCTRCYAEKVAIRFSGPGLPYEGLADARGWTRSVRMVPEHLADPLRWKRPRRIFVNSMSDLFHEGLTDGQIAAVFAMMAAAPQHTFQVLTKRAERMRDWFRWVASRPATQMDDGVPRELLEECAVYDGGDVIRKSKSDWSRESDISWPLPNVWLGVSVEDQRRADERIPLLLQTPAAVRFLSCEPLLGPVDLTKIQSDTLEVIDSLAGHWTIEHPPVEGEHGGGIQEASGGPKIDWVIVGGESGPGAREFHVEWAQALVEQCRAASVACFVKQLGAVPTANYYDDEWRAWFDETGFEWPDPIGWSERDGQPGLDARVSVRGPNRKGGDPAEWPAHLRVREFPEVDRG